MLCKVLNGLKSVYQAIRGSVPLNLNYLLLTSCRGNNLTLNKVKGSTGFKAHTRGLLETLLYNKEKYLNLLLHPKSMKIPELDDASFIKAREKQAIEDSRGALTPSYKPTGHVVSRSGEQHLTEYVSLRSAYEKVSQRDGLSKAAVLNSESALILLTQLRSRGAIPVQDIYNLGISQNCVPVSVGILSQAHLVGIDRYTVHITAEGITYIDDFLEPSR